MKSPIKAIGTFLLVAGFAVSGIFPITAESGSEASLLNVSVVIEPPGIYDPNLDAYVIDLTQENFWTGKVHICGAIVGGVENPQPNDEDLSKVQVKWSWSGLGVISEQTTLPGIMEHTVEHQLHSPTGIVLEQDLTVELSGQVRINGQWFEIPPTEYEASSERFILLEAPEENPIVVTVPLFHILVSDGKGRIITEDEVPPEASESDIDP